MYNKNHNGRSRNEIELNLVLVIKTNYKPALFYHDYSKPLLMYEFQNKRGKSQFPPLPMKPSV